MSNINSINRYSGVSAIRPDSPAKAASSSGGGASEPQGDRVEISPVAQFLSKIAEMPDIRTEKVEEVRQALASGTYDIEGKLPEALDRFLEEYL